MGVPYSIWPMSQTLPYLLNIAGTKDPRAVLG